MGKIGSFVDAQRASNKGNEETAEEIRSEIAAKESILNLPEDELNLLEAEDIRLRSTPVEEQPEVETTFTDEIAPQNLADESAAGVLAGETKLKRLPTESDKMQQEMKEQNSTQPYLDRVKNVYNYDTEGNLRPTSEQNARINMEKQLALAAQQVPKNIDYGFETGAQLLNQIGNAKQGTSGYDNVADLGLQLESSMNLELPALSLLSSGGLYVDSDSQSEADTKASRDFFNTLKTAGLIDADAEGTTPRFNRRFGNAIALQLIDTFIAEQNVKDKAIMEGEELSLIPLNDLTFDDQPYYENYSDEAIDPLTQGTLLDPKARRSDVFAGVIDRVMKNPNRVGEAAAGFGGASVELLTPETKAFGDSLIWQTLIGMDFVDEKVVEGKTYYTMSKVAEDYYNATRSLINDINPTRMILPTLSPSVESVNIGINNQLGFSKVGNVSVKAKRSFNDSIQMSVVDAMGKMNHRILPSAEALHGHQVNSVIKYRLTPDNRIVLDNANPLNKIEDYTFQGDRVNQRQRFKDAGVDMNQGFRQAMAKAQRQIDPDTGEITIETPSALADFDLFYSTNPLAKALGLDQSKWMKAFNNAINKYGKDINDAREQADRVMESQARKIAMNYEMAKRFSTTTFYLQGFYATSNQRFHYRQTVLNPQDLKPNRALLAPAKRTIVDLNNTDLMDKKMQAWMYNVGRVLLPTTKLGLAKAENMGFNQVINPTEKILRNPKDPIYLEWVRKGKILSAMAQHNSAFDAYPELANKPFYRFAQNANKEMAEIINTLSDPEDWGVATQAYINVFNFHNARENKKKQGSIFAAFPEATVTTNQEYFVIPKDNARINELKIRLDNALLLDDADAQTQIKADIFKELDTLKVPLKNDNTTRFEITTLAKPDGKQSGPTLQSLQNGDLEIASRTGIIYSSLDNVIPEGDIRSLFYERFVQQANARFESDLDKREFWNTVIKMMADSNDPNGLIKELSRTPLMEYTYGKFHFFNQGHILNFLRTPFGERVMGAAASAGIPGYAPTPNDPNGFRGLVKDFNELTGVALTQTMNVDHQSLLSDIGLAFAMMSGESASFTGPLGDTVYLGSRKRKKTGREISIPFARGRLGVDITTSQAVSSARPEKRNRTFDDATLRFSIADPLAHGKQLANQLPVLTVQSLDAAIIANAIYRVNKGREDNPAWALFIHDSIISDVDGAIPYMRAYNDSLAKLAIPESKDYWRISTSVESAYARARTAWRKRLLTGDPKPLEVSAEDDNNFVAMYDYLTRAFNQEIKTDELKRLIKQVQQFGWQFEKPVLLLEPARIVKIHEVITEYMNLQYGFKRWRRSQDAKAPVLRQRIAPETKNMG